MARILIAEPNLEVRQLLEQVVRRLGHEPIQPPSSLLLDALPEADVLLVEPAWGEGLALTLALSRERPGLPVVCASSYAPSSDVLELQPVARLLKPFSLAELEAAIEPALVRAPPPLYV